MDWHEHVKALMGSGGGLVVLYFMRDMAKDAWNDYRRGKMLRAQAAAVREGQPPRAGSDVGAMVAHDLVALITKDMDAMRAKGEQDQLREDKRYAIISQMGEDLKRLAEAVAKQTDTLLVQGGKLDVLAARGMR